MKTITADSVGQKIRTLRVQRGLTQGSFSDLTNVSRGYLSRIENGLMCATLGIVERICEHLNVPLWEFFSDAEVLDPFLQEVVSYLRVLHWQQWVQVIEAIGATRWDKARKPSITRRNNSNKKRGE
jgi:transcriptional regulator with XRE-family HTH domain